MKKLLFAVILAVAALPAFSTILIVDINGAGQFTSIQMAIDNAVPGDTIQVWPGTYNEDIDINKNVILQGSGYENTILTSNTSATVTISNGTIKWFFISSTMGVGIKISGGEVLNCVIKGCLTYGIYCINGTTGYIENCIVMNSGSHGIYINSSSADITVVNTISRNNTNNGFYAQSGTIFRQYCNGSYSAYSGSVSGNQGCVDSDPIFVSTTNYHLSTGSPCYNTGQPSLSDPDGTVSDMGYFGGPDCPIFPVVYEMTITPNGNNINVQAKARANY